MAKLMNMAMGAIALVGAGTMSVSAAEAQTGDSRVICNPTTGCGPGQGQRGGAGTGVTDATVWAPVQLYEGTTVVNGKLHRDGHDLIPEVTIAGRTDLAHLDGQTFQVVIQPMPQGTGRSQRITVRYDATPDGNEIVVQAPRGFTNAGIAGLNGQQNGKILRIAMRVCDYGQFIEPPPPPAPPAPPPAPPAPPASNLQFDLPVPDDTLPRYAAGEIGLDIPFLNPDQERLQINTVTSTGERGVIVNNPGAGEITPFTGVTEEGATNIIDGIPTTNTILRLVGQPAPPPPPVAATPDDVVVTLPRVITSDADSFLTLPPREEGSNFDVLARADTSFGPTTNGSATAIGVFRNGDLTIRGGVTGAMVDGLPLGTVHDVMNWDIQGDSFTQTVESGFVDGTQIAPLVTAQVAWDVIGSPESLATGGGYVRLQGGIDPLQGAGDLADNALVNAAAPVDPLTRAIFAQGSDSNVLAGGIEVAKSFGDSGNFQVTARGAITRPLGNGEMGITRDLGLTGEYFGNGANTWDWGYHVSGEARANLSDSFSLTAGATYDVFNFQERSSAEVCGDCGFSYELINRGDQTNLTAFVGANLETDRLSASLRGNWSRLTNVGGQTITGQIIEGDTAYFGADLVGMDAEGISGVANIQYDIGDRGGVSVVGRGAYGSWDMNRFSIEREASAWRAEVGPRFEFNGGRGFVEATAGYESVDAPRGREAGFTGGLRAGIKF
jgi:hypothetical protein